jgi:hypothetical protein
MRASWLCLSAAALVSLAAPSRSSAQDDLTKFRNRETAVWESVKNKQIEALRKVFLRDYVGVYDEGIVDRAAELDGISKMTLRSYDLSDFTLRRPDGMTAIVTYKATLDGEVNGQPISGPHNTLTVWRRNGNAWSVQAHTGVKAK